MPWKERNLMSLREEFVLLSMKQGTNITSLCRSFGISRKTGYKWQERYLKGGYAALQDVSRRPLRMPTKTQAGIEALILDVREQQHDWGGRKIRRYLQDLGHTDLPAASTITSILRRNGYLDQACADKHKHWIRFERDEPNELWQMDFKGHFKTDAGKCYPLTVLDDHSRFSLGIRACSNQYAEVVQEHLVTIFRKYGMPCTINVDNGPPWGSDMHHKHTKFTTWLIRLGIHVSHSRPFHPQTNGKLERFHRSLKSGAPCTNDYYRNLDECQERFDEWRTTYNMVRPHDSLGGDTPISRYKPSARTYPEALPPIEYDTADTIRKVDDKGFINYKGNRYLVTKGCTGYPVALRHRYQEQLVDIYFCNQIIKTIHLDEDKR